MQHCFLLSRKSLRFLGSAMGIAIANRKNRCDFGALSTTDKNPWSLRCVSENNFDNTHTQYEQIICTDTQYEQIICTDNMPESEGSYGVNLPCPSGTFRENVVYEPTLMHTNPDFYGIWTPALMPHEPNLLGMGLVFNPVGFCHSGKGVAVRMYFCICNLWLPHGVAGLMCKLFQTTSRCQNGYLFNSGTGEPCNRSMELLPFRLTRVISFVKGACQQIAILSIINSKQGLSRNKVSKSMDFSSWNHVLSVCNLPTILWKKVVHL